jgi:hypothetical protein
MWLRLRQVAVVARHLAPALDDVQALFGLEVAYRDPTVVQFGLENAVMPVGHQFLEIVAPVHKSTTAGRYLDRRGGDGGYMVILQCDEHGRRQRRVRELGVRTVLEHDDGSYSIMQLHPRDTGGTFLEVDEQRGGQDTSGPWAPAGPRWQDAVRTDVVVGIAAAEVQTPEPARVAARWAEVLERSVTDEGTPVIALDDGEIRFVPDADGRGEGLGGVDLVTVDPGPVVAAATERGLRVDDDTVMVAGVRVRLVAPR